MHVRRCLLHSDHITQTQWEQGVPFEKGCVLLKYSRHQQVVLLAWATETELECFSNNAKKKYSWLLFSFNPTDPRDAASPRTQLSQDEFAFGPGREASLWRRGRNKNKLVLQISLGSKMLVCEVKNRTRLECWRIWKCSGLFLCPGLLLDSSSSRRSRTSVMKQGWPQLPLKTQSEHLVFPKVMLGFVKSFFLGWLQFVLCIFLQERWSTYPFIWLLFTREPRFKNTAWKNAVSLMICIRKTSRNWIWFNLSNSGRFLWN